MWVGNDARLPTQNTKLRVGKLKTRGGKVKKIGAAMPNPFLPTLFRKRAGAPGCQCHQYTKKENFDS